MTTIEQYDSIESLIKLQKDLLKEIECEESLEEIKKLLDKADYQSAVISSFIRNT
jgi:hypothetical protein